MIGSKRSNYRQRENVDPMSKNDGILKETYLQSVKINKKDDNYLLTLLGKKRPFVVEFMILSGI